MVERSSEIEQVLHDIIDAMARSDLDAIAQRTSRAENVVGIGTDASEWTEGYDELMQLMRESLPDADLHLHATLDEVKGFTDGDVGWAAGRGSFAVGDQRVGVRLTAVLHREDGDWKVVQTHASIGVPNDRMFDPLLQPNAVSAARSISVAASPRPAPPVEPLRLAHRGGPAAPEPRPEAQVGAARYTASTLWSSGSSR